MKAEGSGHYTEDRSPLYRSVEYPAGFCGPRDFRQPHASLTVSPEKSLHSSAKRAARVASDLACRE